MNVTVIGHPVLRDLPTEPVPVETPLETMQGTRIAAIDRERDSHGYIRPGLGDAGGRIYGTT